VAVETILDTVVTLNAEQARSISTGWISDDAKIQSLAESDGRNPREIVRDAVTGMVGEWGAYLYVRSHGIPCQKPDCGVIVRDRGSWDKDLLTLNNVRILTAKGKEVVTVDRVISCKSQLFSSTARIRDTKPSWTFQLPGVGHDGYRRNGDPMLLDGTINRLLIVSWIDDRWKDKYVYYSKFKKAYKDGFRWSPQIACFWWCDVFPYLADPRKEDLLELKKCLYYEDIKHLRVAIIREGYDLLPARSVVT
jgi:hypothetical protein